MSSHCTPLKSSKLGSGPKFFVKGASEGVLDRCTHARIGGQKVPLTSTIRAKMLELVADYGCGRDTLRCLTLATMDTPMKVEDMDIADSTKFINYEVSRTY